MGMGMSGAYADAIEDDKLKALFPKEHAGLLAACAAGKIGLGGLAEGLRDEEELPGPRNALDALRGAFGKRFSGLTLSLEYHDQENQGDRYDEVDGAYWAIDGLYVLSKGARKLGAKNFERKFFVNYG